MDNINIQATDRSPEIAFDFSSNKFAIRGESYPEDATTFYGKIIEAFDSHLTTVDGGGIEIDFELIYFNSSSAKVLMGLMDTLEETANRGVPVVINWLYHENDDGMEELGEEFAEDIEAAVFNMRPLAT